MEILTHCLHLQSETDTVALGSELARLLRPDDVIGLVGPLGAGKSVLARAILTALPDQSSLDQSGTDTIPSPTFTLIESYDKQIGPVAHFDLYRIEAPSELDEIGLVEAMDQGPVLIEWAERAAAYMPATSLLVAIEPKGQTRRVSLTAGPAWLERLESGTILRDQRFAATPAPNRVEINSMSDRETDRKNFLAATVWAGAERRALTGDASSRRYERLFLEGQSALFMDVPQDSETAPCPPGASIDERLALGYNACARLAGARMAPFMQIAATLSDAGFSAPRIYAVDEDKGFAILEDLGDDLFARVAQTDPSAQSKGAPDPDPDPDPTEEELYANAVDVLAALADSGLRPAPSATYELMTYDETAMLAEVCLLTEWYLPLRAGVNNDPQSAGTDFDAQYQDEWRHVLARLSPPSTLVLRDYHAENLLWLPDRDGLKRTGLIDFQDALWGHGGYDLVSLLEDARRDVSAILAERMIDRFIRARDMDESAQERFHQDYAILGAQRNAKILGIFARLAARDGKERYLTLLPRVEAHFRKNISHPVMAGVRGLLRPMLPELTL